MSWSQYKALSKVFYTISLMKTLFIHSFGLKFKKNENLHNIGSKKKFYNNSKKFFSLIKSVKLQIKRVARLK